MWLNLKPILDTLFHFNDELRQAAHLSFLPDRLKLARPEAGPTAGAFPRIDPVRGLLAPTDRPRRTQLQAASASDTFICQNCKFNQ